MADSVTFVVRVTPRAGRNEIAGTGEDGSLRIRVTAAPHEGAANRAAIRLLATALDVPPSVIEIVAGAAGRQKRVRVEGIEERALRARWPGVALAGRPPT